MPLAKEIKTSSLRANFPIHSYGFDYSETASDITYQMLRNGVRIALFYFKENHSSLQCELALSSFNVNNEEANVCRQVLERFLKEVSSQTQVVIQLLKKEAAFKDLLTALGFTLIQDSKTSGEIVTMTKEITTK
ncbi:hypothetical protein ACVRY7_07410 [Streptococcus ictaluri]|uniref:Uncharacterized protein n=1 Tax=Streptococcus ictaluri 707-05 TaxID=764299 RepID=G5K2J3_9STRE|nr:hypothetical protein [Streptococcus ictaluri]EHI69606.1 hypothetical protein STRIC_1005 [Streptococcus ictaluri 707-05]